MKDKEEIINNTQAEQNQESVDGESSSDVENTARRKALRNILTATGVLAGSQAIPSQWSKPILKSVVAPAHAMTSGPTET